MKVNPGYKDAGHSCFVLAHIAVRDLGAEECGKDETQYCDDGEYDRMLEVHPADWFVNERTQ